jgi:hypothetical protein
MVVEVFWVTSWQLWPASFLSDSYCQCFLLTCGWGRTNQEEKGWFGLWVSPCALIFSTAFGLSKYVGGFLSYFSIFMKLFCLKVISTSVMQSIVVFIVTGQYLKYYLNIWFFFFCLSLSCKYSFLVFTKQLDWSGPQTRNEYLKLVITERTNLAGITFNNRVL